jgi:hypothetical protein
MASAQTLTTMQTAKPRASQSRGASKPLKPTKWGVDLLVKIEAFRQALAAQK